MDIILYFLNYIQYQQRIIRYLFSFICRYIPLRQWAFNDSHSPKYQKFKTDELPLITDFRQDWTYKELIPYFEKRYGKKIRPVNRRAACDIPDDCCCPRCGAPKPFLYKNNGSKGQILSGRKSFFLNQAPLPTLRKRPCSKEKPETLHHP